MLSYRATWAIAFFVFVLALGLGFLSASKHSPNQRQTVKEQTEQQKAVGQDSQRPSSAGQQRDDTSNAKGCNCGPEKNWWEKLWTDPIATFTGALFLATAALIFTGLAQWWETRRNADRQLRAYLSVISGGVKAKNKDGNVFLVVKFEIKNAGQTPAYKVSTWFDAEVRDLPQFVPAFAVAPPPETRGGQSIVGPGTSIELHGADLPVTADAYTMLSTGEMNALYVWGQVDYVDAFGKPRWTKFRMRAIRRGEPGTWTLGPEPEGNDAT